MATAQSPDHREPQELPVVCSLGAGDLQERLAEIAVIGVDALIDRSSAEGVHLLRFRSDPESRSRLEEIVAAEAQCCAHLHRDHADVGALGRALDPSAVVLRPEKSFGGEAEVALIDGPESALQESGLTSRVVKPWESVEIGPFSFTALPAADGFGDPQVSWCIAANGCRILHAGDTLFHGWWWLSALRQGPFDVAFLPVGGAVVDLPSRQPPSPLPAGMDPRQAAVAAKLLGARTVVPIHYGRLHQASNYVQADDPPGSLRAAAAELGIEAQVLEPGERFSVQPL